MIAAVAFVLASLQSPLERVISPHFTAMPAKRMLDELGKANGVKLDVSPPLSSQIVMLEAKDVSLGAAIEKLAKVLDGKWIKTQYGYVLRRPPEVQRQLQERDRQLREQLIRKELEPLLKRYEALNTPEKRAEAVFKAWDAIKESRAKGEHKPELYYDSPAEQFMVKLAAAIGPKELSKIDRWARVVWSNKPKDVQKPLPPAHRALLEEFKETEEHLKTVATEKGPAGFDSSMARNIFESAHSTDAVEKISFGYFGDSSTGGLQLLLYKADGRLKTGVWAPLRFGLEWVDGRPLNKAVELERLKLLDKGPTMPVSTVANEMQGFVEPDLDIWSLELMPQDGKHLSPEAVAIVTEPDEHDPLSLIAAPGLAELTKHKGKLLAACLTDWVYHTARTCTKDGQLNLSQFEALLARSARMESIDDGDWLLLKPLNPYRAEADRAPRQPIRKYLEGGFSAGEMALRPMCTMYYEGGADPVSRCPFRGHYEQLLVRGGVKPFPARGMFSYRIYALLGSLTDAQWQGLTSSGQLDCGTLTSIQRDLGRRAIPMFMKSEDQEGVALADIFLDPTESMPRGPGAGALLILKVHEEQVLQEAVKGGDFSYMALNAKQLGEQAAWTVHDGADKSLDKLMSSTYRHGSRIAYISDLKVLPGMQYEWDLYGPKQMSEKTYRFSELPEAFRKEVEKEFTRKLKEIEKERGG
jgi:hypothetical protein